MLLERLIQTAKQYPDVTAIIAGDKRVSYRQLIEYSARIAAKLQREGVKKGDFVTIEMPRCDAYVAAMIGVWMAGAAFAALDVAYPQDRLDYIATDCRAKVRINDLYLQGVEQIAPLEDYSYPTALDRSLLVYTSGSTGKPKGVLHTHQGIYDACMRLCKVGEMDEYQKKGQVVGEPVPFAFVAGLSFVFMPLVAAATLCIIPDLALRDPRLMTQCIEENGVNIVYMPPKLLRVYEPTGDSLQIAFTGSEKVSDLYRDDICIINGYGSSESCSGLLFFPIDKRYDNTPIGKPYGQEKAYVLDENGHIADEGELCLAGHFAEGYWNLPEQTREVFVPNPFRDLDGYDTLYRTGDLVKRLEDGNLVYINRKDWMIKLNGQRVEPGEIESAIRAVTGVKDAAVKDYVGAAGQTYICAYYVKAEGAAVDEARIENAIRKTLPAYMIPAYFVEMERLPLNANGKLDRKALTAPEISITANYVAPRGKVEKALAAAFEKALNIPRVGAKDDFFTLGGDSIRVMVLQQLCPQYDLSTRLIYEARTVEGIAKRLRSAEKAAQEIDAYGQAFPLTQSQLGIFLTCEQREGEIAYNNPILLSFAPTVDAERLQAAVQTAVGNHPGLLAKIYLGKDNLPLMQYAPEYAEGDYCPIYHLKEQDMADVKAALIKPFYIKKERLFRFGIYQTEARLYLFLDIHHIAFDGASYRVLLPEILGTYSGKTYKKERYTAYHVAADECEARESGYDAAKEWYLKEFGDVEEITLPQGDKKENDTVFQAVKIPLVIDPDAVKGFCIDRQITDNVLTTGAFGYLLSLYTTGKKTAFATVYNGRHDVKTADTVTMMVKTLPVLCTCDPTLSVAAYLNHLKEQMMGAMVHDVYSFRELVSATGYTSDVLFTYQGDLFQLPKWGKMDARSEDLPFNATGEKLGVQLYPLDGRLVLDVQYHGNLYSEQWVRDFAARYAVVLNQFLCKSHLKEITLVDDQEAARIVALSYGGDVAFDATRTYIDMLLDQVAKHPDKRAVVAKDGEYTYDQLDQASNAIAHYLIAQGVTPGSFVAVKMRRVKEVPAAIAGIQKAGAAYIPIDPEYPADRIAYMLEDSQAKVVLTEEAVAGILSQNPDYSPVNLAHESLPAYMIYTSGSTGKPKGVVILHHSLTASIAWRTPIFGFDHNSRNAAHPSFSFDASVEDLFAPLANGGEVHILSEEIRMDLDMIYDYLKANGITGMSMSTQIGMSLVNAHPDLDMQYIVVGGEKLLPCAKTRVKIYNGYGPTEFTVCSSYHLVDQEKDVDIPIGRAVPNSYSLVCDACGNLLPLGMTGELCLAGIQISEGYYNRPELNRERFVDCRYLAGQKMYRTGDLARYNADGELEYQGRIDFQVKLRGFRIELGEVENTASQFAGVKQVIALVKNKQLVLYYTADEKVQEADLKAFMAAGLTEYMVPSVFIRMDAMPLNPSGKIDRRALPEPTRTAERSVAPRGEEERRAYEALAKILGYEDFGVTDDFNDVGLTSLSAMQYAAQLSNMFNKAIRVSDLAKYPTIESLLGYLSHKEAEAVYDKQADYPLTMAQGGILTEVLAHPDTTIYNIPVLIDLPRGVDLDRLKDALVKAVDAHPYLKTRIISNERGEFRAQRHDEAHFDVPTLDLDTLAGGPQSLVKPFDLLGETLARAYILKGKTENKLFFDAHHIVFDGESLDALFADVDQAYCGHDLTPEAYSEYELALDEQKLREGKEYEEAKEHYRTLLEDKDVDCLPVADHKEEGVGKKIFDLKVDVNATEVERFLKDSKSTVNSLWISAFGLALARFLGRGDALFTTVYNGRNDVRVKRSVGMFVHTLPVVCEPFKAASAAAYVKQTADQLQKSMANDIYGFMEIAHDYEVRADILFVYEGKISQGFKLGDVAIPDVQMMALDQMKASILLAINDLDEGYYLHVEYDGDKYQEWSIASLMESTVLALKALVSGQVAADVSLLSQEGLRRIADYNATEVDIDKTDLVSAFRRIAKRYPDNVAAICRDKRLTYRQVDEISDRIAGRLAEAGVGKGNVVSILISRSENMVLTTLGVLKTGAAYQPLDHTYPTDRLLFMIEDASASYLIADEGLLDKIPGCTLPILLTKDFDTLPPVAVAPAGPAPEDLMILLYTSGTTGTPKGVMLTHANLNNFCHWYRRYYSLTPDAVVAAYAGFGFDACMMDLYPALTTGAAVCVVPNEIRMNMDQLAQYFEDNSVTHSFMTTQVGRLFATTHDHSSLRYLSVGGEKLSPLEPPAGYALCNGYGPTECTIFSTTYIVDKFYMRIPIGKPLDNYKLYVVDDKGHQLPEGALGELWIAGYGVGLGYLNQAEKTRQTFIPNPFDSTEGYERVYRTGDVVRRLEDGSIDFIGRNDGQVKIRGFRIELGEVEMAVRTYPGIKDVTVQAFDAEGGGKFLAAYFTADNPIDVEGIKAHILRDKPPYMVPACMMQLDAIPLNQNQKVNKRALPKPTFVDDKKTYVEPADELEKDFCQAYGGILGIDKVSATDSFFDIGGTSLTAARVVIFAVNKGYPISYQDIFEHPSPRELADFVKQNRQGQTTAKESDEFEMDVERPSLQYNDVRYVDEIKAERPLGTVLLAGATGFLGTHLLKELLDQEVPTIILVRSRDIDPVDRIKALLMYYFDSPLDDKVDRLVRVINEDITSDNLSEVLKDYRFDTIINSAAIVKHFSNDDIIERVNVGGVLNLIAVAKERNARLVQTSTLSVAGENVDHHLPDDYRMKENQLYFGQDLSNKYANSKFKAEKAMLDAIEDGMDGKIVRLGNLMSRHSDGEFQINNVTNAFMRNLRGYKALEMFPISALDKEVDFSPIDETAKTILLLAKTPAKFTVFHSLNSHVVQMGDVIDALNLVGMHIEKVDDLTFANAIKEAMQEDKKSMIVSSLLSYAASDGLTHELVQWDSSYTVKALYRLGYRWPITDFDYLTKAIRALITLGFFERDDM